MYTISYTLALPESSDVYSPSDYVVYLKETLSEDKFNHVDRLRDTFFKISLDYERKFTNNSCHVIYYCAEKNQCTEIKNLLSPIVDDLLNITWHEIEKSELTAKELVFGI